MANSSQRQSAHLWASASQTADLEATLGATPPGTKITTPPGQVVSTAPGPVGSARRNPFRLCVANINNSPSNVPLYGSLNLREAIFFCKATAAQLKTVVASAPRQIREQLPPRPNKNILLDIVMQMRQDVAVATLLNRRPPSECLDQLLKLKPARRCVLSPKPARNLKQLMTAASQADADIEPRHIPESSEGMIYTVLTWQIKALQRLQESQDNCPPPLLVAEPAPVHTGPAAREPVIPHATPQAAEIHPEPTARGLLSKSPPVASPNAREEILFRIQPEEQGRNQPLIP